jgi:hypothetical protein
MLPTDLSTRLARHRQAEFERRARHHRLVREATTAHREPRARWLSAASSRLRSVATNARAGRPILAATPAAADGRCCPAA